MNLPLGKSQALTDHLERMNQEMDAENRELDAKEAARVLREQFDAQVSKYLRRVVTEPNGATR